MNPHNPTPQIPQPERSTDSGLHGPTKRSTAFAIPAIALAFLLLVAAGAGALRWASNDQPDLVAATPAASEPVSEVATAQPAAGPAAAPAEDDADEDIDEMAESDDGDVEDEGEPSEGDDTEDQDDEGGDELGEARAQCAAVLEELLRREEAGLFGEETDDEDEELTEEEFEQIEVPSTEFDGSVDDPDDEDSDEDGDEDRDGEDVDEFGDELELESLSNSEVIRGLDACFEAGILDDEGDEDTDEDGRFEDEDGDEGEDPEDEDGEGLDDEADDDA